MQLEIKMRIASLLVLLGVVTCSFAGEYSRSVTNRFQILPNLVSNAPPTWVNGQTNLNGDVTKANGDIWMCLFPGVSVTSGIGPVRSSHTTYLVQDSNTTWMLIKDQRQFFDLSNWSGGNLTLGLGTTVSNGGGALLPAGATYHLTDYQEGFWVNATSATQIGVIEAR